MTEPTVSQRIAGFASAITFDDLPADVVGSMQKHVLDILGICVAASSLETSHAARAWVRDQGGRRQAHAIGMRDRVNAVQASFVNGVLAHSLDYDDTHLPSVLHPSASVVPAALAVAEQCQTSGQDLIAAIAVGLEVCVRLGMAGYDSRTRTSAYFEHGQHATSICGAMGGAVSAALLYGMDTPGICNTLGVAASMASGIIEANRTGGTVKRMHCGWAARSAVSAAQLVKLGYTGPPTVIEGRFGFLRAWLHEETNGNAVADGLGEQWALRDIFFKPYPANHFTHTAIDAAATLRAGGLDPHDIDHVELGVAAPTVRTIGEPIALKQNPPDGYSAKFSGPYAVVVGLLGGSGLGAGLDDYGDALARDPYRRELMSKISVIADEACTNVFPRQFPCRLRVRTKSGKLLEASQMTNRGGPDYPLSFDELATKFRDNARRGLDADAAAVVKRNVDNLSNLGNIDVLLEPLTTV